MSAFMIVANRVFDNELFWKNYAAASTKLVESMGGKYRILTESSEVLEGEEDCEGAIMVVVEWPDMETCRAFWNSPEYSEIKKNRSGISHARVWLTEGEWLSDEKGAAMMSDLRDTFA